MTTTDLRTALDALGKAAYWYYLMTRQGGPDGSELDDAVVDDMADALTAWAKTRDDADDYLPALTAHTPPDSQHDDLLAALDEWNIHSRGDLLRVLTHAHTDRRVLDIRGVA